MTSDLQDVLEFRSREIALESELASLRAQLAEAERDAGRWRAVRPLMCAEGWIRTDMARECWLEMRYRPVEGEDLTVEQIVDAIAQREERK